MKLFHRVLHSMGWYPGPGWSTKRKTGEFVCTNCDQPFMTRYDALQHWMASHA